MRRLQAELQHALDIERSRNAEAAAGRDAAAAAAAAARGCAAASARAAREIEENRQQSEASKVSVFIHCQPCIVAASLPYACIAAACFQSPTYILASQTHLIDRPPLRPRYHVFRECYVKVMVDRNAMQLQWELAEAQVDADAAEKRAQEAMEAKAALQQSASELAQKVQDARAQTERTADEVFVSLRAKVPFFLPVL